MKAYAQITQSHRLLLDRIAALITLRPPTAPMKKEAAATGIYDSPWGTKHARLQILTVRAG